MITIMETSWAGGIILGWKMNNNNNKYLELDKNNLY